MSVKMNLNRVSRLCKLASERALFKILSMGPKPQDPAAAVEWQGRLTALQDSLGQLTAIVIDLNAQQIIDGLSEFDEELKNIGEISKNAQDKIKKIQSISDFLEQAAKILDLGVAIAAAMALPSPTTISAAVSAATEIKDED